MAHLRKMMRGRAGSIRQSLPENLDDLSVKAVMMVFMGGLILFYGFADFENETWAKIYYVWDMSTDMLAVGCIYLIAKKYRVRILPILVFTAIRALWEITAFVFGQHINSSLIINYLFLLTVVILGFQMSISLIKEWNK